MGQSTLSVKIDNADKLYFEDFCKEVGMNVTVAINMFIKAVIREKRLPFEIRAYDPFYSEENMRILNASIADAEAGKLKSHNLIEV